jgi:hypothetical protein
LAKIKKQKGDFNMKFRTAFDTLGYSDNTVIMGESMVDPSHYVPTDVLLSRMLRGEHVVGSRVGQYDVESDSFSDSDFDKVDVTRTDGFDLSDVPIIQARAKEAEMAQRSAKFTKPFIPTYSGKNVEENGSEAGSDKAGKADEGSKKSEK